jgi:hypothetical protein
MVDVDTGFVKLASNVVPLAIFCWKSRDSLCKCDYSSFYIYTSYGTSVTTVSSQVFAHFFFIVYAYLDLFI